MNADTGQWCKGEDYCSVDAYHRPQYICNIILICKTTDSRLFSNTVSVA